MGSNNVSIISDNITTTNNFIERNNDMDENDDNINKDDDDDEKLKPVLPLLMKNLYNDNSSTKQQQQPKQEKTSMIMNNYHRKQYKCGSLSNEDNNGNDKRNGKLIDHGRNRYNNHREELVAGGVDDQSDKRSNRQFSHPKSKSNNGRVLPASSSSSFKCGTKVVSSKPANNFKNHHTIISPNDSNLSLTSINVHNNVNRLANIDDDKCANKFKSVSFSSSIASNSKVSNYSPRSKRLTTKPPLASKKIQCKQSQQQSQLSKNSQIPRLQTHSILSTFSNSNKAFPISNLPTENIHVSASDTFTKPINANTDARNDNGRISFPLTNSISAFKPVSFISLFPIISKLSISISLN